MSLAVGNLQHRRLVAERGGRAVTRKTYMDFQVKRNDMNEITVEWVRKEGHKNFSGAGWWKRRKPCH